MNQNISLFSSLKNINFNKILVNTNKTLNFASKAIPMYQEIRPTFNNIKKMFSKNENEENKKDEIYSSRPIKLKKEINKSNEERNYKNDTLTFFV